jgi:DeoR/GlpR family transcriptional regulator of sugar metabolism
VDKLFFSCKGVHPEAGLSESNELQAKIKQIMIGAADRVILLADATKFGVRAFTHVSGLERVDEIITDRAIDEAALSSLQALGINVIVV